LARHSAATRGSRQTPCGGSSPSPSAIEQPYFVHLQRSAGARLGAGNGARSMVRWPRRAYGLRLERGWASQPRGFEPRPHRHSRVAQLEERWALNPQAAGSKPASAAKLNEVFNFVTPWPRGEALGRNPRYARSNRVGVSNRGVAQRKRASSGNWRPGSQNSPPRPSECSAVGSARALGARGRRIVTGHSDHLGVAQRQRAWFGTRRSGSQNSPPRPSQAG
jgi:hypothetical protein